MEDQKQINDIIAMLDSMALDGVGHMNIRMDDTQSDDDVNVEVVRSIDCSSKNMACSIPTIQNSIDTNED